MKKRTSPRICLAASAGGHLTQLRKIAQAWSERSTFWVITGDMAAKSFDDSRVYAVAECNRQHPFRLLGVLAQCMAIVLRERPDVVISTGAAPGCLMCLVGRLLGAKVVWLDSIANVDRLSLSGWFVRPFADLFLVQWPELARRYPNTEYVGTVI